MLLEYDLLVIGGGIHGAWIARDAALRGLSVCLVEKEDWGWGTSAKSSKLVHGGLRYLELLEFGLVHESLQERERLFRLAPHLVRPLRFLYPVYPHVASRRTIRAGLLLYDLLSHGKSVPGRDYLSKAKTLELVPGLNPEGLVGGATFYDGQIRHVERLVAELVRDARRLGARCLNHTRVAVLRTEETPSGRRVTGARIVGPAGGEEVRARVTVNAAGAWVDEVLGPLSAGRPPKVRRTKGIHVVVPRFTDTALIVKAQKDGRAFFILPWERHSVIGTTDTDYVGDAGDAAADTADVSYLLEEAARYFPQAPLSDIRYTYAGVRALVNEEGLTESNVTRRHLVYDHARKDGLAGLWTLQGGKITTARSLAEEVVDRVARDLGQRGLRRRHPTRQAPLPGAPLVPWAMFRSGAVAAAVSEGLSPASAEHLVDTYGAAWRSVLACDSRPAARGAVPGGHGHLFAEITWAVREEQATTLADVMLRRTDLGLGARGNPRSAVAVAGWMGDLLGWDEAERERRLDRYRNEARVLAVPEPWASPKRPEPPLF